MAERRIYALVNPSDAVCFDTDDEEALAAGILVLGEGWYGLTRDDGSEALPLRPFGDAAEEVAKKCVTFLNSPSNLRRSATALRTILYCSISDRKALESAFSDLPDAQRIEAIRRFNDSKRSSMNDIGARALRLADQFEKAAEGRHG